MPDYNYTIVIPANTSKDDPVVTEMILTKGIIAGGQIFFPFGCRGYVHVTICDGQGQLYPANAEDTYHADGVVVPLVGRHVIDSTPYKLYIKAWSSGTSHEHKPQVTLSILDEEELKPYKAISKFTEALRRLMGIPK